MNFDLNPEQQQLADSVRRWAEKHYSFVERKAIIHSAAGISETAWKDLAELGVLALSVPEEQGGFNGTAVDMMAVMHELGRALIVEPVLPTLLGVQFLKLAGHDAGLLEQVAAGELKLACALAEQHARYDLLNIATTAHATEDGFVLNGTKCVVLHGAQADWLVVSARTSGEARDAAGITLFVIPADSAGMTRTDYRTNDGMRAANIVFNEVHVSTSALLGEIGQGSEIIEHAVDDGIALLCAEAVGVMEALTMATVEYLKTRQQFGVPIGKFQALQHRMAEMFMHLEQARSMAMLVAVKLAGLDTLERRSTASAAKARIGEAAKFIGQQAVQLHGGMGVTNELLAAHYFKRLAMMELTLGDTDHHLVRFAAQPGFKQAA